MSQGEVPSGGARFLMGIAFAPLVVLFIVLSFGKWPVQSCLAYLRTGKWPDKAPSAK